MVSHIDKKNYIKEEIFLAIKETVAQLSMNSLDVTLVCKDNQRLETNRRLLGMASPLLREILASPHNPDTSLVILPNFSQVKRVVEVLSLGWQEEGEIALAREDLELLNCLGVQMGTVKNAKRAMQPVEKQESLLKYVCDLCEEVIINLERHFKKIHTMTDMSEQKSLYFLSKNNRHKHF